MDDLYIYVFVRTDYKTPAHQVVQAINAVHEQFFVRSNDVPVTRANMFPGVVLLELKSYEHLKEASIIASLASIALTWFTEDDGVSTALCTEPIPKAKGSQIFRQFKLWQAQ